VRDSRDKDRFSISNTLIDTYLPKIGTKAFAFYCALVRASEFGGMLTLARVSEACGMSTEEMALALDVLEENRLIDFQDDLVINSL
jgi:replication initiation and membrane attachment protein DnaB